MKELLPQKYLLFLLFSILLTSMALAQIRGEIIKAGDSVLDPNGDGFISETTSGFSIDGYYVDEFELKMFGVPFAGDGETSGDGVQSCTTTDLSTDTTGFSAYGVLEGGNLIFRFRLAGDRPSVEAYTILIDTDRLLGPEDPNYLPGNPGFEVDITLIKNQSKGVFIYDLDGTDGCPTSLRSYPYSTHFQSAVAGTTNCDDEDYFYDFYIPFQDLTDLFGITPQSELRFVALTNVSATCAMGGSISDVGGVNDDDFASFEDMFAALTAEQCPTAIEDLCQSCEGFKVGSTEKPIIDQPVKAGETMITGSAEAGADIFMEVYDLNSNLIEDVFSQADLNGSWEITLSNPLNMEDSITARAQIEGTCSSGISASDLSYAVAIINQAPVLTGTTSALVYTENADPLSLFGDLSISDPDDTEVDSAWLTITSGYDLSEDIISLPPGQGITITWNAAETRVELYGKSTLAIYESVIAGIGYSNSSEDPTAATRSFSLSVHDGLIPSNELTRDLTPAAVNDPPVLSGTTGSQVPYAQADPATLIDPAIAISDLDHTEMTAARVTITSNYLGTEDLLQFASQNGITGTFDGASGKLTLTGTASIVNYEAALQSVQYFNSNTTTISPLTRTISFRVFDGTDSSNISNRNIDITVTNSPPDIVDSGGTPLPDTINVTMTEDIPLDTCLDAVDPDGDLVYIRETNLENGQGAVSLDPNNALCLLFTPTPDYFGEEYTEVIICDGGTPEICDTVVVSLDIIAVNDLPEIVIPPDTPIDTTYLTTTEDTPLSQCIDVIDTEGDLLELSSAFSLSMNGSVVIDDPATFCYTYTPDPDFFGFDTLSLVVCEQLSTTQCDTLTAIVEVTPVNDPPVVEVDPLAPDSVFFSAIEDVIGHFCVTVVDPDTDVLQLTSIERLSGPGIFDVNPPDDLCFFFQSSPDSTGFVYAKAKICDNGSPQLCDSVIVVIEITPVNDDPVILDEFGDPITEFDTLRFATIEDMLLDFCVSASDPDANPLELTAVTSIDGNGSYTIGDTTGLCVTYNPNPDFNGIDVGEFTVCDDNGGCTTRVLIIEVEAQNDPPEVVEPAPPNTPIDTAYYSLDEDTFAQFCLNAVDADGNPTSLSAILSEEPNGAFDIGDVTDLCFTYTPDVDFYGEVTGKLVVCDDQDPAGCDTVVVVIDVIVVNDPPVIVENGTPLSSIDTLFVQTDEDNPLDFCLDVTDPDGDPLTMTSATSTNGNGSYVITDGAGLCFTFTPDSNFNGEDAGEVTVCDDNGACTTQVIVVTVNAVNDPPSVVDPAPPNLPIDTVYYSLDEDTFSQFCLNAVDSDGNPISLSSILSEEPNGAFDIGDVTDLCFTYTPDPDFNGEVTGKLFVCDDQDPVGCDTVVVVIDVISVNDSPVIGENGTPLFSTDTLFVQTDEDIPLDLCLEATDPDGDALTLTSATSTDGNGSYVITDGAGLCMTFTPDSNFSGDDTGVVTVCDDQGACMSQVIVVEVLGINDPPEILQSGNPVDTLYFSMSEDTFAQFCVDGLDSDGDLISLEEILVDSPNGTFSNGDLGDLCFNYSPDPDYYGEEVARIVVCDNQDPALCDTVTVIITIDPVNDEPVIVYNGEPILSTDTIYVSTEEDTAFDLCLDATDPDGDQLTLTQAYSSDNNGMYTITNANNLCINYTPNPDFNGEDAGLITVCDDAADPLCSSVVVMVTVSSINDAPVIMDGSVRTDELTFQIIEDTRTQICIEAVDADGDALSIASNLLASNDAVINPKGGLCFDFTPNTDFIGQIESEVIICDNQNPNLCDTVTVFYSIVPINDPPSFVGVGDTLKITIDEDESASFELPATDPDMDELTYSSMDSETNLGTYTFNGTSYEFTPDDHVFGVEYATISVCDGGTPEYCDVLVVEVNIRSVNDIPDAVDDSYFVITYYAVSGNVLDNDSDIENDLLRVGIPVEQRPMNGELTITEDGNITYKPRKGFKGTDSFVYVVCDDGDPSECVTAEVLITVEDPLIVYEALSPNGDGLNDLWIIEGIENYPNNQVKIFDRYNRLIYEMNGYNNQDKVWTGQTNNGIIQNDLPTGTYFYLISLGFNEKPISGYIILKTE